MSIETRIIRGLLKWLWSRYQFQMMDVVIPKNAHIQRNPSRKSVE
jgi:hypothetical protein